MLSIMDPVELENLVLFRDDEDPQKFYILPDEPAIPLDDNGVPDFYFIKYIRDVETTPDGQPLGGGYVQFRTTLTIAGPRKDRVLNGLRTMLTLEKAAGKTPFGNPILGTEPTLAAPIWTAGTVKLETFKVGDNELVRKATESVPVDLAGSLGASVDLQLDPDGAEIFWASFKSFTERQVPIVISYQLTYKARVSARLEIHANRTTVEDTLWGTANPLPYHRVPGKALWARIPYTGVLTPAGLAGLQASYPGAVAGFSPDRVSDALKTAITNGTIVVHIETDEAGSGADANKVQEMLLKLATDVLSGRVIPALFGDAGGEPSTENADDPNAPTGTIIRLDSSTNDTTRFDIVLDSTSTIERSFAPSGPIHVLLKSKAIVEACFKEIRITDGFFGLMKIAAATAGVSFQRDHIDVVHLFLRYDQVDEGNPDAPHVRRSFDGVLRSDADVLHWKFDLARDAKGGHKRTYEFRTDVFYGDLTIANPWTARTDEMLLINPAAMGAVRAELVLTAPRDQVKAAHVTLEYVNDKGDVLSDQIALTSDEPRKTWFKATGQVGATTTPPSYSYAVVYTVGSNEITMPKVTSSSESLELPGPFVRVLTFTLRPQGSFDGVANIVGDVTYDDPDHGYRVVQSFQLDKLTASTVISVPVMDGGPDHVRWTGRINHQDGSTTDLDGGDAPAGTVWVGAVVVEYITVQIVPDLIDFAKDVQLATVVLTYAPDPAAPPAATKAFTFSQANKAQQSFKYGVAPGAARAYKVDIQYIAYDRTKSSDVHLDGQTSEILVLDRQAR